MSAFGRKSGSIGAGIGTARKGGFGQARPMQGGAGAARASKSADPEPEIAEASPDAEPLTPEPHVMMDRAAEAMNALEARGKLVSDSAVSEQGGFEASIYKIKEQVMPRLLERIDPEAAAALSKDELSEEFGPIIGEVLAELKLTLNRREQIALEKVLVDELLGLGPLEELLA
ncbi:MAG: CpaF family protein, partial [Pseudomonadota bacterium]